MSVHTCGLQVVYHRRSLKLLREVQKKIPLVTDTTPYKKQSSQVPTDGGKEKGILNFKEQIMSTQTFPKGLEE